MSANQERKMRMIVEFQGNASNAIKAMNEFERKFGSVFKQMGVDVDVELRKTERKMKQSLDRMSSYGKRIGKQMSGGAFLGGSSGGIGKEFDSFELSQGEMRGSTTGLRHEVGKLRNTLLLVSFATASVVSAFRTMFTAVLQNESAMIGLKAVAISTGLSFDRLKESSVMLENSGIMSITGASAAQKNLAASKMSLMEINGVMSALTDAAAFNRQGTLSMEEAVVGATQGIKNQNSIMIDNAGITKNVSIMYREYAASVGKSAGSLSEHEKRQAMVSGIMKEAALFAGNAEKSMFSYQGRLNKLNVTVLQVSRNLGEMAAPNIMDGIESLASGLDKVGKDPTFIKLTQLITLYFKELLVILPKIVDNFMSIPRALEPLADAFDSPIAKMTVMSLLLLKMNSYAQGFLVKFKQGQLQSVIDASNKRLSTSAVLAGDKTLKAASTSKMTLVQQAQHEAQIRGKIADLDKKGVLNEQIQITSQKALNTLLAQEGAQLQQNAKYRQLINDLTIRGFNVYKTTKETKVGNNKIEAGSFVVRDANANLTKDSLFNRKGATPELVESASPGAGAYNAAGFMGKVSISTAWMKKIGQSMMASMPKINSKYFTAITSATKTAMTAVSGYVAKGSMALNTLRNTFGGAGTAAINFGKSVAAMGMTILAVAGQFMMYYSIVMSLIDIFKEFAGASDAAEKKRIERVRTLELERKSIQGLSLSYSLLGDKITGLQKFLKLNIDDNIFTSLGSSLGESKTQLNTYLADMRKIEGVLNYMTKEGKDKALNPMTGKEAEYSEIFDELDKLKTKFNEVITAASEAHDRTMTIFTDVQDFMSNTAGKVNGSMGDLAKSYIEFSDNAAKWTTEFLELNTRVTDDTAKTWLGLSKDTTYYEALMFANTKAFELEKRKMIIDSEKKITEIKKAALAERMKGVYNSQSKEAALMVQQSTEAIKAVESQIRDVQNTIQSQSIGLGLASISMDIDKDTKAKQRESANQTVDTYIREAGIIKNLIAQKSMQLNSELEVSKKNNGGIDTDTFWSNINKVKDNFTTYLKMLDGFYDNVKRRRENGDPMSEEQIARSIVLLNKQRESLNQIYADMKPLNQISGGDKIAVNQTYIDLMKYMSDFLTKGGSIDREIKDALIGDPNSKRVEQYQKLTKQAGQEAIQQSKALLGQLENQKTTMLETLEVQKELALYNIKNTLEPDVTLKQKWDTINNTILTGKEYVDNYNQSINDLNMKFAVKDAILTADHAKTMDDLTSERVMRQIIATEGEKRYLEQIKHANDTYEANVEKNKKLKANELETIKFLERIQLRNSADTQKIQNDNAIKALSLGLDSSQASELQAYADAWENFNTKLEQSFTSGNYGTAEEALRNLNELAVKKLKDLESITLGLKNQTKIQAVGSGSITEMILGIDAQGMASIDQKYKALINSAGSYYMNIAQIAQYSAQMEEEKLQKKIAAVSEFSSQMIQAAYGFGRQLGQVLNEVNGSFDKDKNDMIKSQQDLLLSGEISQAQYADRVMKIHDYAASRVNYAWTQSFNEIGKNMLSTVSNIMSQMGSTLAGQKVAQGASMLTGLTAALPYAGIAMGLGFLGEALFGGSNEPEVPEFTQTNANQLSKFGGTIKAEEVKIEISPTFIIEGQQVFIGSGSIVEFVDESTELLKKAVQQAIDNREFDLSLARG